MTKYISFLLVPIMLLGINNNSSYSMDNYEQEKKISENYNKDNNYEYKPKYQSKRWDKMTKEEREQRYNELREQNPAVRDAERRRENRHKKAEADLHKRYWIIFFSSAVATDVYRIMMNNIKFYDIKEILRYIDFLCASSQNKLLNFMLCYHMIFDNNKYTKYAKILYTPV